MGPLLEAFQWILIVLRGHIHHCDLYFPGALGPACIPASSLIVPSHRLPDHRPTCGSGMPGPRTMLLLASAPTSRPLTDPTLCASISRYDSLRYTA